MNVFFKLSYYIELHIKVNVQISITLKQMSEKYMVSISSKLCAKIFCTKVSFFYVHVVTREKLPKQLSYEKFACITLIKFTEGVQGSISSTFYAQLLHL